MTVSIAKIWGDDPATVDLIAFAAGVEPTRVAFDGVAGPVLYGPLNMQVSATAGVLAAQGIDTEAAVGAMVTAALSSTDKSPEAIAEATRAAVAQIRADVRALAGSADLATLPGIFRSSVARFADRTAVTDHSGASLTYAELDARADAVAAGLVAAGAGPESTVGVALPRTVDLVVALLGVLKSGAAYLPLDQSHPVDRLQVIIDDAHPVTVVTDDLTIAGWSDFEAPLSTLATLEARAGETPLPVSLDSRSPAYVIYTSGTTGKPKGVSVSHAAAVTLFRALGSEYDFTHQDVWTCMHSYAFDLSVGELWPPLMFGGRLVVVDYLTARTPEDFARMLGEQQATVVNMTPSAFYQLADAVREPARVPMAPSVRTMIFVGEALDFEQVRRWMADRREYDGDDGPQLNNMYGPTEATVYLTRRELTPEFLASTSASDVGTALDGSRMYVLNARLAKVPDGVPGDLYLAGDQLARGYDERFDLNATRFVADPFGAPGDRMYLSGDLAMFRNGSLEFLGRADDQVKVRGYRIELGEVESGMLAADGVRRAAAAVKSGPGMPDRLVGYVVGVDGADLDVAAVRRTAATKVPDYMVPDVVMVVDDLPMNVNGKLDRKALPDPVVVSSVEYVAPANETESVLAVVVAEVLGLERVGVTESVFDLGGNSLLAARIIARAGEQLGVDLNLRDLFEAPTIREFAVRAENSAPGLPPVTAVDPRPEPVPLSFAQQRMWFINQFDPEAPTYNIPALLKLTGIVDTEALRQAVVDVVSRHEVLRTTFPAVDGGVSRQAVGTIEDIDGQAVWEVVDSRDGLESAVLSGFDLTTEWPLRFRLWSESDDEHLLAVVAHHIASDGQSVRPLIVDLATAYAARTQGSAPRFAPLEVQFADFAIWQHRVLGAPSDESSIVAQQIAYWRDRLAGAPDVLELPTDRPRPAVATHRGADHGFTIPADLGDRIVELARSNDVTPFMVMHAALAVLLARLSGTEDISVSTPIAGRGQAVLDPLVGMFVNTLVLRTEIVPGTAFVDLLGEVRTTDLDAFAHADAPFETIVEALNPVRSEAFAPLAQVMLSFDPAAGAELVEVAGLGMSLVPTPEPPAQLDLSVTVTSGAAGEEWVGTVNYATDLFDASTAALLTDRFIRVLTALTDDPTIAVDDIAVLAAEEEAAAIASSSGRALDIASATVYDLVSASIAKADAADTALLFRDRAVSFAEFGARVNVLARELIDAGVGPDRAVGVCMDRGVELVVAVHAIVAAGGQYVPIDPGLPADRVEYMIATAGVSVVLVAADAQSPDALIDLDDRVDVLVVDGDAVVDSTAVPVTDSERTAPLSPSNAAYTLFTSGSTGKPKGVTVPHEAIVNRLVWGLEAFPWAAGDRVILKTPYTFDVSLPELFGPIIAGATMVIAEPGGHADPDYLIGLLEASAATSVHFVPSMLSVFLEVVDDTRLAALTSLKWLFASGEALPPATVRAARRSWPAVEIHNLFGPTEAAVEIGWADVSDTPDLVTIGRAVPNSTMIVLDGRLRPAPEGTPGELYLGGVQLARGYAARADLTAERFIADPFGAPGARLYRTGDLVRRLADGNIEYLGRTDFQVKLRGQRVELGEIESALAEGSGVVHAAATVASAPSGGDHLVAYIAPSTVDLEELKDHAAKALPVYMVPSVWMLVDDIALNTAGKIDRRALPAPEFGDLHTDYVAPRTEAEAQLAAIVAGLLNIDRVSVTDSFFGMGGDSIMSIQLASQARAVGLTISPRLIFEHQTVRAMAQAAAAEARQAPMLEEPAGTGFGPLPIPPMAAWMIENADGPDDFADYSQSLVLVAPDDLDAEALRQVLAPVVGKHPMLAARLVEADGEWQYTAGVEFDAAAAVLEVESGHAPGDTDYDRDLTGAFEAASARLNPAAGRLVQAALVRPSEGRPRLVLVIHHLGVDAVSWRVVVEDLVTAWFQRLAGKAFALRDEGTSQRAWTHALAERAESFADQRDYWLQRVPTEPTDLGTPFDRSRDRVRSVRTVDHLVDAEVTESLLTSVPEAFHGNVNDVLLGTLARAVRSWQQSKGISDGAPVAVLMEGHGRYEDVLERGPQPRQADLSRTVGWFTTVAPLRLDPDVDVVHAIKAAKEERLGQPDSGVGFGYLKFGGDRELGDRPLPSIVFNYLGAAAAGRDQGDGTADANEGFSVAGPVHWGGSVTGAMVAMGSLSIVVSTIPVDGGGRRFTLRMEFPEAVLDDGAVSDLAARWAAELESAVDVASRGRIGYSPADVPGVELTQADLDDIDRRSPGATVWPLSPLQRGLYFQAMFTGQRAVDVYLVQAVLNLGPNTDVTRLKESLAKLMDRHRVLRSGFDRVPSGALVAFLPADTQVPLEVVDLRSLPVAAAQARLAEIRLEQRLLPFDLARPPLIRVVAISHAEGVDVVITNHHILYDGWSGPLVVADLLSAYTTGATYTEHANRSGGDFEDYLRLLDGRDRTSGLEAWAEALAPFEGPTLVAPGAEARQDAMPGRHETILGSDTLAALEEFAQSQATTVATALQVAWAVFLSRVTGNRVVSFGETVSGRPADLDDAGSMVGLFINTLPVVVDVRPDATLSELLGELQAQKIRLLDHQHLGLPEILSHVGIGELFDTLTIHESYPVDMDSLAAANDPSASALVVRGFETTDATHYPLNMITTPSAAGLSVDLRYLPSAFSAEQIDIFAEMLVQILTAIVQRPDMPAGDVEIVSEADAERIMAQSTGLEVALPGPALVGDVFAEQARRSPDATALVFGDRTVTYAEFSARANSLARELIAAGVGPESSVAVAIPRSVEMMVAVHATVIAGGQYVPVDLGTPADRVEYMLETAHADLLLVSDRSRVGAALSAAETVGVSVHDVSAEGPVEEAAGAPVTAWERRGAVTADSAVYTLFTSGSTGKPKGVTLTHEAVLNRLWWGLDELPIDGSDVVVQKTPYTFDCSVPELFAPLMVGATLVVLKDGGHLEPAYVASEIARTGATMVHFVPSMLSVFLEVVSDDVLDSLHTVRIVSTTGEALPPAVAAGVRDIWPDALFYNLYGPTEAAVEITYQQIGAVTADDLTVPIGVPVWNSSAVVLDGRLQRVPAGVPGELYLGGVQLARGYAARADLTSERFVADPYGEPGTRLYRTGDLVRRLGDGSIEYLGRTDFQVKLRGQRIELGEIESVLAGAPGVVHAAATVASAPGGGEHLIGYVAGVAGEAIDLDSVRAAANRSLPGYMVPTVWTVLDDITLNTAGKLDRKALPAPEFSTAVAEFAEPVGDLETAVAAAFADVLGVDRVSVTESFFDVGGNSLSAMRVVARAGEALGVELSVRDLFDAPSVRELVATSGDRGDVLAPITAISPRTDRIPLSFAQQRMWFINRLEPELPTYNIPVALRLTGVLDVDALRAAVADVVERHEILRTTFPEDGGEPYQLVHPVGSASAAIDWAEVDTEADLTLAGVGGFDVAQRPPFRVRLRQADVNEWVLLVVIHHIVGDGESMKPLLADMIGAYAARAEGHRPVFDALPVQFADYSLWQHRELGDPSDVDSVVGRQLAYWETALEGLPELVELPTDRSRPAIASHVGAVASGEIPAELGGRIDELARSRGVTSFMVVHAALAVLIARMSATDDIAVATPIAGRGQRVLDPMIGMFVNTLVLRSEVKPAMSFDNLLMQVRDTDLEAFAHADVPFESLVERLNPVRSQAFTPLTQVMLTMGARPDDDGLTGSIGGLTVAAVDAPVTPAQLDLTFDLKVRAGGAWSLGAIYATDLFVEATIVRLIDRFIRLLDTLTDHPADPIALAPLVAADERSQLAKWSVGAAAPTGVSTVPDIVG